jgi:hypothetical protein
VELEMQPHDRLSPYLKIKHCAKVLSKEIPALSASISSLPLATAKYPFNRFKNDVLELCNNLLVSGAIIHDRLSTNSSVITPNSQPSSAMVNMSRQDFWDTFDKQDNLVKILVLEEILPRGIVVLRGIRVLSVDVQDLILMIEAIREIFMAKRN